MKPAVVYVEEAECPRGGKHTEGVLHHGRLYCLKCLRSSAEIDEDLNGTGDERRAQR